MCRFNIQLSDWNNGWNTAVTVRSQTEEEGDSCGLGWINGELCVKIGTEMKARNQADQTGNRY